MSSYKYLANFYQRFYLHTNGFIPSKPLNYQVFPGDFFQIRNGRIVRLGNIYKNLSLIDEEIDISEGYALDPFAWNISDGQHKDTLKKDIQSLDTNEALRHLTKQILRYERPGSFSFVGSKPESIRILNWDYIQDKLLVQLTESKYSFRELYVVTEVATAEHWSLVVSGQYDAELELTSDKNSMYLLDLFGDLSIEATRTKGIELYERHVGRSPSFFKAKKLALNEKVADDHYRRSMSDGVHIPAWAVEFFDYDFDFELNKAESVEQAIPKYRTAVSDQLLDLVISLDVNLKNALTNFKWVDANLDDIMKYNMSNF